MTDKQRKVVQNIFLIVIILYLLYGIIQSRLQNEARKEESLIYTLETYANDMNGVCPIDVGNRNELIIQKVYYVENKTVVSEYRFLNYDKTDFDIQQLKENLSEPILDELEMQESLAILRNKNVIFEYRYFDNQNEEMFRLKMLFNTPITFIDGEVSTNEETSDFLME